MVSQLVDGADRVFPGADRVFPFRRDIDEINRRIDLKDWFVGTVVWGHSSWYQGLTYCWAKDEVELYNGQLTLESVDNKVKF